MKNFSICWVPRYRPLTLAASTRIRLHYLHKTFVELGIDSRLEFCKGTHVIFLQKVAEPELCEQLFAHRRKQLVLFDYDDMDVHELRYFNSVMNYVDVIVVDTEGRRRQVEELDLGKEIFVLEDCIDYNLQPISPPRVDTSFVWFGYHNNFGPMARVFEVLGGKYPVTVITDCERLEDPPACLSCIRWDRSTFVRDLQKHAVSVLSHEDLDPAKSNNKMLVSITAGVPSISGESPSYEELLTRLGLGWAVARTDEEFLVAADRLSRAEERTAYLKASQPYIWERYSRWAIAERLIDFIRKRL